MADIMKLSAEELKKEEEALLAREAARKQQENERLQRIEAEEKANQLEKELERRRREAEEIRRRKEELEWKRLGSDVIQKLPGFVIPQIDDMNPETFKAWYLDDATSSPTYSYTSLFSGKGVGTPYLSLSELRDLGIVLCKIPQMDFTVVYQLVQDRCYKCSEERRLSQTCKDEVFLRQWFEEHYNVDEQFRLILDGSCYYDVRSRRGTWIRLAMRPGDLIIIPPGLFQRGSLDEDDYCSIIFGYRDALRFSPIWRSDPRAGTERSRLQYLQALKKGPVSTIP